MCRSVEIERKFVLPGPPAGLDRHPAQRIEQGYLAVAPDGVDIRIRRRGDTHADGGVRPAHVRVEEEL